MIHTIPEALLYTQGSMNMICLEKLQKCCTNVNIKFVKDFNLGKILLELQSNAGSL